MRARPKMNTAGERVFVVQKEHAIDFADGCMPAVLSTPWLIWFLEHAAREAIVPLLDAGESTVGTMVEVRHLAATPVGGKVRCLARVVQAEGPVVSFQLAAHDDHELIARGFHKLRVIQIDRFAAKVGRKAASRAAPPIT